MNVHAILGFFAEIGGLIAFVTSIVKGYEFCAKKLKPLRDNFRVSYCRHWGNQGQFKKPPSHYIEMVIWEFDKELRGRYNICPSADKNARSMYDIRAKRYFGNMKCTLSKMGNDGTVVEVKGMLIKKGRCLYWKLRKGSTELFPKEAILNWALPNIA